MARFNLILAFVIVVILTIAEAGLRERRSPQFGQASASAAAFGGNRSPPRPGFGRPGPGFGIGRPGGNVGGSGFGQGPRTGFGPNQPGGQGVNINIAKSVSISTGGRGTALSQASSSSRG